MAVKTLISQLCDCRCGTPISYKKIGPARIADRGPFRYARGHQMRKRIGSAHQNWKGGRSVDHHGYVVLQISGHPLADSKGRVREHRLVMSHALGRWITSAEHVHHKNGVKTDNRPENLQLVSNSEHQLMHEKPKRIRPDYVCLVCGGTFRRCGTRWIERPPKTCSLKCRREYGWTR